MALNRLRCFRFAAKDRETAFLAGTAGQLDCMIPVEASTFPTPEHTFQAEDDLLTCTLEATEQIIIAKNNTMSVQIPRVRPQSLGFIAAYALGDVATEDLTADFTGAYRHKIGISAGSDLPSFAMEEEIAANIGALYQGCGILDFSITATLGTNRKVDASANLNMAKRTANTGPDDAVAVSETPLDGAKSAIFLGTGKYDGKGGNIYGKDGSDNAPYRNLIAGPTGRANIADNPDELSTKVHSITWSFNNNINLENAYRFGGGLYPSVLQRGVPTQTVDLNFDYTDETEFERFDAQTDLALQWSTQGKEIAAKADYDPDGAGADFAAGAATVYDGFNIVWPKVRYQGYQRAEVDGKQVIQAAFTVLQPQGAVATANTDANKRGSDKSVEFYLWNSWERYAA